MCKYCDINSNYNEYFIDPLDNQWYQEIETMEWDEYDDGFVHQKKYITYCPWCGRKLGGKKNGTETETNSVIRE